MNLGLYALSVYLWVWLVLGLVFWVLCLACWLRVLHLELGDWSIDIRTVEPHTVGGVF